MFFARPSCAVADARQSVVNRSEIPSNQEASSIELQIDAHFPMRVNISALSPWLEPHVRQDNSRLVDRRKEPRMRALEILDRRSQSEPGGFEQLGLLLRSAGLMGRGIEKMRDAARVFLVAPRQSGDLLAQSRDQLQELSRSVSERPGACWIRASIFRMRSSIILLPSDLDWVTSTNA